MYIGSIVVTALAASSTTHAFSLAEETRSAVDISKRSVSKLISTISNIFSKDSAATCPPVWNEISTTLTAQFLLDGQCTDAARAAIRGAFHDCFNGACDGSLILANECANPENAGLERLCANLANVATQTGVGVADLIQFAAAHAIKTCPGGPTVPFKVGRKDSSTANPLGVLPKHNDNAGTLIKSFGKFHCHS